MAYTPVTLTGTVLLSNAVPAAGAAVTATLNTAINDGVVDVNPRPLVAICAADGTFSLDVLANDDTTTQPTGTYYTVVITHENDIIKSLDVVVPHADAPSVPLFTLAEVSNPNVVAPYVSQLVAGGEVTLSPAGGTGQVTVSSPTLASQFGAFRAWSQSDFNLALGSALSNLTPGVGQNATSNLAIGGGVTDGTQPDTGNLGQVTTGFDNLGIGTPALPMLTTGRSNVAIGADSQSYLTTGSFNTGIGAQAAEYNVIGQNNTAIGVGALRGGSAPVANLSMNFNTAIGASALNQNTADGNTAVGYSALNLTTTGGQNTAIGYEALNNNTTGTQNVAIGYQALSSQTGPGPNTAIGTQAASATTTAVRLTAIGYLAAQQNVSAADITAVGFQALTKATAASNTAVGSNSCHNLTSGHDNAALGLNAGDGLQTGIGCTCIGSQSQNNSVSPSDHNYMTTIGYNTSSTVAGGVAIGVDHLGNAAAATVQDQFALGTANHQIQILNNATGAGSAALGANCPATTLTAPHTWFKMTSFDGSTVYVPAWK